MSIFYFDSALLPAKFARFDLSVEIGLLCKKLLFYLVICSKFLSQLWQQFIESHVRFVLFGLFVLLLHLYEQFFFLLDMLLPNFLSWSKVLFKRWFFDIAIGFVLPSLCRLFIPAETWHVYSSIFLANVN